MFDTNMEQPFEVKNSRHKTAPLSECPGGGCLEKCCFRLGTWNVRGLLPAGKLENVKEEMRRYKLDILGLSEIHWKGEGVVKSDEFHIVYSGGSVNGLNGVGLVLSEHVSSALMKIRCVSERVIMVRFRIKRKDLVIIQVCIPSSQSSEEEVNHVYDILDKVIQEEKRGVCVVVMGDWNAVVGEGQHKNIVGKFGLGERNERGNKLIEFCERNEMVIGNTMFEQQNRRRYTWKSPPDGERYQVDYILVQNRYKNGIKNSKSMPGAVTDSDHVLVVADMNLRLKNIRWGMPVQKGEVEKFREENVQRRYKEHVKNI